MSGPGAAAPRRIKLVVTGDMERRALGPSIVRAFGSNGSLIDTDFLENPPKENSFTTAPLPPASSSGPIRRPLKKLARTAVAEALYGTADLVIAVDDLELANLAQPDVVVWWVRRAFEEEIQRQASEAYTSAAGQNKAIASIRARCSFHLLVPMVESYLFGDSAALARAGAVPTAAQLSHQDLEDFETNDGGYLSAVAAGQERAPADGISWLRYAKHPKRYVEHLAEQAGGSYDETTEGVDALESLDWPVVAGFSSPLAFARAFFEDVAELLDVPNPLGPGPLALTYPSKSVNRAALVLRNL